MLPRFNISLLVILLIGALSNGVTCEENELIVKTYGDIYPDERNNRCENISIPSGEDGQKRRCNIGYRDGTRSKGVLVELDEFISTDNALHGLLFRYIDKNNKSIQATVTSEAGKSIMKVHQIRDAYYYFWISDKYLISILASNLNIPPELLNDYQTKYPPTHIFTADDFDMQKFFDKEIMLQMQLIDEADDYRDTVTNKADYLNYIATVGNQCNLEITVKCIAGLAAKDAKVPCTIAGNKDDSQRKDGWEELRKQIENKPAVLGNIDWRIPKHGACVYDTSPINWLPDLSRQ